MTILMTTRQAPTPWTVLRISTRCKSTLERSNHHPDDDDDDDCNDDDDDDDDDDSNDDDDS